MMTALYYLTILMYLSPTGEILTKERDNVTEVIVPGTVGAHGPDKAACEKWGDEVRKTKAKDMGLKDYRQLKYRCDLRPVVY